MLEYDRIDVSEGIYANRTSGLRECIICHYWYFLKVNFRFQPEVCNSCHDLTLKDISCNDFATIYFKRNDYGINFWGMSKDEVLTLLKNTILTEY